VWIQVFECVDSSIRVCEFKDLSTRARGFKHSSVWIRVFECVDLSI
jgi:hypothetical protein